MNKKLLMLLLFTVVALAGVQEAAALPSYLDVFNATYPSAVGTRIDDCKLCHVDVDPPHFSRNPYGLDFANNSHNFTAIELLDSDNDTYINIAEINNLTFPGNGSDPGCHLCVITASTTTLGLCGDNGCKDKGGYCEAVDTNRDGALDSCVCRLRVTQIVENMTGIPIINQTTTNILSEDYINFSAGDPYNITVTRVTDGTVEYNASGTLMGEPIQTIPINWTPQTQGAYILRSEANTTADTKTAQVINQKIVSPIS